MFKSQVVENMVTIDLHNTAQQPDRLIWPAAKNGILNVKSAYEWISSSTSQTNVVSLPNPIWDKIWKINSIPRIPLLVWKCYNDILPVRVKLVNGIPISLLNVVFAIVKMKQYPML